MLNRTLSTLPLSLLFLIPLALSLATLLPIFVDTASFGAFLDHPQFWGGLKLTLASAIISTAMALLFAVIIVSDNKPKQAGVFLAVPHLALAIALAFLIAPTGMIARVLAQVLQWSSPPQWITVQDPYAVGLSLALILKETPFLVWALNNQLQRDDLKLQFEQQARVARSLGHGHFSTWIKVILPQVLPLIIWPLLAVLIYGMTVVDMALVIGPTQPPTLATMIWRDINDAEPAIAARGAAGTLTLSFVILLLVLVVGLLNRFSEGYRRIYFSRSYGAKNWPTALSGQIWGFWRLFNVCLLILTSLAAVSGLWPFPKLLPEVFSLKAVNLLLASPASITTSLTLAITTSITALIAVVLWLEFLPSKYDRIMLFACAAALCIPPLVIALGQYRLFLSLGITGTWPALYLAHVLPVTAYIFVMLQAPYRAYDQRWSAVAAGLLAQRLRFLSRIKWPMLKAPLLSATAIGFAVSIAQYVPAQLSAAGRFSTLPMEAVTLSSGGNRALIATYALALTVLPLLAFVGAQYFGRPRWHNA